jgi:ketosteroid isomerase-like protein
MMTVEFPEDSEALAPFFDVVREGLDGLVDGEHFFDFFAEDAVTEYVVTVPAYPKRVDSRAALMELYRGYGDTIRLERSEDLRVHHDREQNVVVLEYGVHGKLVGTGAPYDNRFVSIITIEDRKIVHWRDYLDSLAVVQALGDAVPVRD